MKKINHAEVAKSLEIVYGWQKDEDVPVIQAALQAAADERKIANGEYAPVIHAQWIEMPIGARKKGKDIVRMFICSNCNTPIFDCTGLNYCPNCGAIVDGNDGEPHDHN